MKKVLYIIAIFTVLISFTASAQTQLWSMTSHGGSNNYGTIFKMNLDGSGYTIVHNFDSLNGSYPGGSLLKASNGKLYGMTSAGGSQNDGVIFSIDPNTAAYTVLYNFTDTTEATPYGSLIQINSKLYGMTFIGGTNFGGTIFSIDTASLTVTDLYDFDYTNGGNPEGDLLLASNGLLYGMTNTGGANNVGTLFSFNTTTLAINDVHDFDSLTGNTPTGSLIQPVSNGKLYGMAQYGGANQGGVVFSFNPTGNVYTDIYDFTGNFPFGNLIKATTGRLYGITYYGGPDDDGFIFSLNPSSYSYDSLNYFDGTNGFGPSGSLFQASNGKLYGMTALGVSSVYGSIFSMDTTTNAITDIRDLSASDGNTPVYSNFIEVSTSTDTITTGAVTLSLCDGSPVSVPYTATGTFIAGNVFTAQLSNATGSFASPTAIGTLTSTTSGSINATIPSNTPAGVGYRIRVVSSNPQLTGSNNGANITINITPTVTITPTGNLTFCQGGSVLLTASSGGSYLWSNAATTQSITATVSGNYSVTVTNANSCSAASTAITVTVNPLPSATVTPSGNTTFCQGSSILLTAALNTSYLWSNGMTTQAITVAVSGNYSVTVTGANGCTAASTVTSVTVNPLPSGNVTVNGNTTFCQGGSVLLTAAAGTGFQWSNGATTQAITVTTAGNYTVTVTNSFGCTIASLVTPVIVNPLPSAGITTIGSTIFCQGDSVILTSTAPGNIYLWSNAATTQSVTIFTPGNYTVTVTNNFGCSTISSPIPVTVNPLPNATITSNGPDSICQGDSVTISSVSASFYHWSSGATAQSITVTHSGSYFVVITDANHCSATSNTITVAVSPLLTATIFALGNTTFCNGDSVRLKSNVAASYLWSNGLTTQLITVTTSGNYSLTVSNSAGCSGTASQVVTVNPTYSQSVSVSICSGNTFTFPDGDTSSSSTIHISHLSTVNNCDSSITTTLTVSTVISENINAAICQGDSYTFPDGSSSMTDTVETSHFVTASLCDSNIVTTLVVNPTYAQNTSATICHGSTYTFPDNTTSMISTVHTSHLSTINNCDSSITTNLFVTTVDTSVSLSGITLTAQATSATYQWIDCSNNTQIANATNQSYTPTGNGHYAVVVTQDSCSDTSSCFYIFSVGLIENTISSSITIAPNPSNGNFILNVNIDDNSSMKLKLTNVMGEIIQEENLSANKGIFTKEINLMSSPSGIYFLNLSIGEISVNRKIIVTR